MTQSEPENQLPDSLDAGDEPRVSDRGFDPGFDHPPWKHTRAPGSFILVLAIVVVVLLSLFMLFILRIL